MIVPVRMMGAKVADPALKSYGFVEKYSDPDRRVLGCRVASRLFDASFSAVGIVGEFALCVPLPVAMTATIKETLIYLQERMGYLGCLLGIQRFRFMIAGTGYVERGFVSVRLVEWRGMQGGKRLAYRLGQACSAQRCSGFGFTSKAVRCDGGRGCRREAA